MPVRVEWDEPPEFWEDIFPQIVRVVERDLSLLERVARDVQEALRRTRDLGVVVEKRLTEVRDGSCTIFLKVRGIPGLESLELVAEHYCPEVTPTEVVLASLLLE